MMGDLKYACGCGLLFGGVAAGVFEWRSSVGV